MGARIPSAMAVAGLPSAILSIALRYTQTTSSSPVSILYAVSQTLRRTHITSPRVTNLTIPQMMLGFPTATTYAITSSFLSGLWDSILRAVPKKKTSHRKKRQRFLAGKALKDVTNLNTCSACGEVKRAHLLCPYCVDSRSRVFFAQGACTHALQRFENRGRARSLARNTARNTVRSKR